MNRNERAPIIVRGDVRWYFNRGRSIVRELKRHNVITYAAADIMARLLGGDATYVPQHIGFMYGSDPDAALLPDPDTLPENIKRQHTWSNITSDTASVNANILVAPLILNPSWSVDGNPESYSGNAVTVAAFTGTMLEYAFPTNGSTYAHPVDELATAYFYQALLLNRRVVGSSIIYTPFARVSLKDTTVSPPVYHEKPEGFELSLFWTITFN